MKRFKRMLVYLHGTPSDLALIRYVANFARLCESEQILWVMKQSHDPVRAEDSGMQAAESILSAALASSATPRASNEILRISKVHILERPTATDLSSLAEHSHTDLMLANLKSHAVAEFETLVTTAPCSILWVNPSATPHFRKILVPVDFSSSCTDCVQIGANLAQTRRINRLFLFHSVQIPLSWYRQSSAIKASTESLTTPAHRKMQQLSAQIDPVGVGCTWHIATANQTCSGIRQFEEQLQPDLMILNHSTHRRHHRPSPTVLRILNTTLTSTLVYRSASKKLTEDDTRDCALASAA